MANVNLDLRPKAVAEFVFDAVCVLAAVSISAPFFFNAEAPAGSQPLAIVAVGGIGIVTWKLVRRWKLFDK